MLVWVSRLCCREGVPLGEDEDRLCLDEYILKALLSIGYWSRKKLLSVNGALDWLGDWELVQESVLGQ